MIRLRTLGGLSVERDDSQPAPTLQRRPLALLAVLAAARDLGISRDKLLAYFWPESDEDRARNVLRQLLHTIRRDVREQELFVGTTELRLNPALINSDFAEFEQACDAGDHVAAVGLYRGPFLDGFYLSNAEGFESWKESERARLARRFVDAAERVARAAAVSGDHARAIGMWQRVAATEPLNSRIASELVQAMAAAGDVGGALKHARVHEAMLREELGAVPDSAFRVTVSQLVDRKASVAQLQPHNDVEDAASVDRTDSTMSHPDSSGSLGQDNETSGGARRQRRRGDWRLLPLIGGAIAIAGSFSMLRGARQHGSTRVVDPDPPVFVVAGSSAASAMRSPPSAASSLYQELARWQGLRLVDWPDGDTVDLHSERAIARAISVARRLGAERLVVERRWTDDKTLAGFTAFDVRTAKPYRTSTFRLEQTGPPSADLHRVARELLTTDAFDDVPNVGSTGTVVLPAWAAYVKGQAALNGWALLAAQGEFRRAASFDPRFAEAQFWLARVSQWIAPRLDREGRQAAQRALELGPELSTAQREVAGSLLAMGDGRFVEACDGFRRVIQLDSLDFAGWFGLGDCQAYDTVVVADSLSPTGWRFRASYENAIASYERALHLAPSFQTAFGGRAFERLSRLLFVDANRLRVGVGVDAGGRVIPMAAYATLVGDTIAFDPLPVSDIQSGRAARAATTRLLALQRNRVRLRELMRTWLARNPRNPEALEGYALSLEVLGDLGAVGDSGSAFQLTQRARRSVDVDADSAFALRLMIAAVRLALKSGEWWQARSIADSLLDAYHTVSPETAADVAAVAAVCGRVDRAALLLAASAGNEEVTDVRGNRVAAPVPAVKEALRLLAYASFDDLVDSLRATHSRLNVAIDSYVEAARREQVRTALVRRPLRLSGGTLGSLVVSNPQLELDPLIRLHAAVRGRDTSQARALLRSLADQRINISFRDIGIDQVLQESLVSLAIGDSAAATAMLDKALTTLPGQSTRIISQVPSAAALMRAMLLRAEIARRARDLETARRWATPVAYMWERADPQLTRRIEPFRSRVVRQN